MATRVANAQELYPVPMKPGATADSDADLAAIIVEDGIAQVAAKRLEDKDDRGEFLLGCLALLTWRVRLRLIEEYGPSAAVEEAIGRVKALVCKKTRIDPDEFNLALVATKDRPRVPYGLTPLQLALKRTRKRPLRLLSPVLEGSSLTATIAGIAMNLQDSQGGGHILLPVDDLRELLGLRKLSVSGALTQLVDNGILECVSSTYHTGRARTFRFVGIEGKDYELAGVP